MEERDRLLGLVERPRVQFRFPEKNLRDFVGAASAGVAPRPATTSSRKRAAQPAAANQSADGSPAGTAASPRTQPATLDAEAMRSALAELNHADAAVRRQSFERLMAMSRSDLDAFRTVVEQAKPLLPAGEEEPHEL